MANKLITALRNAHLEGIKRVSISSLSARTGILAPKVDMPDTWGVKSWDELQQLHNIYREGKGKAAKFYEPTIESLVNTEESLLPSNGQGNGKQEVSTPVLVVPSSPESSNHSYLPTSTLVQETDNLLAQLESTIPVLPMGEFLPSEEFKNDLEQLPLRNLDDLIPEEESDEKPNWTLLFGKLSERNPIYARIAAIAACYYHPSYDFQEYFALVSLIREGMDAIHSDKEKLSKISNELAQWQPSEKFGVLLMGILSFNCPRYLLKNPKAKFSKGGYSFALGERPAKLPLFIATGKTESGKSEIIKMLLPIADGSYSISNTVASAATTISQIKDRRLPADSYHLGYNELPIEYWDTQQQVFTNPVCLIPDLSRTGKDFTSLEDLLKCVCEQDRKLERASAFLDGKNKSFLLSGTSIAISSTYELSDDPNHPISELIRRSVVIGCYGLKDENAEKIRNIRLKPEELDWSGFNLSYLWQKEFYQLPSGNWVNEFVCAMDQRTNKKAYPILNAEAKIRKWEGTGTIRPGALDFLASLLAYGLVCYVRRNRFITEDFLRNCVEYYLQNTSVVLNVQKTSSEFSEQFKEVLEAANAKLSQTFKKENYAITDGIPALLIQKHYTNTQKRLLASKKDIPSLTELMSHLGYEARLKDADGRFYEDFNGEYETRYFLTEDATLKV